MKYAGSIDGPSLKENRQENVKKSRQPRETGKSAFSIAYSLFIRESV